MCSTIVLIDRYGITFGQRLKTDDNIAYIAYIMVLISIWPRGHWRKMAMLVTTNQAKLVPTNLGQMAMLVPAHLAKLASAHFT